jgi:hypothetical protein
LAVSVRRLIPLLTVAVLIGLASCGNDDDHKGPVDLSGVLPSDPTVAALEGDWAGELKQSGVAPFEVAVRFTPGATTRVAYTGIECGGTWSATGTLDSLPPFYLFDERIDQGEGGECKGTGNVSLHPRERCTKPEGERCGSYQHLDYEFRGGGVVSKGVLTRVSETDLERVFDEAGVDTP